MKKFLKKVKTLFLTTLMAFSSGAAFVTTATPVSASSGLDMETAIAQVVGGDRSHDWHYSYNGGSYFDAIVGGTDAATYYSIGLDCSAGTIALVSKAIANTGANPYSYFEGLRGYLNADKNLEGLMSHASNVEKVFSSAPDVSQLQPGDIIVYGTAHMNVYVGGGKTFDFGSNGASKEVYTGLAAHLNYMTSATSTTGEQPVSAVYRLKLNKDVTVNIKKKSTDSSITASNNGYSLAGAIFNVYNGSTLLGSVGPTDANGYASNTFSVSQNVTSLQVKETTASKGFKVNGTTWSASFPGTANATYTVNVDEDFNFAPIAIKLKKVNAKLPNIKASNVQSMEGTKFQVQFWEGTKDTNTTNPDRVWVFQARYVDGVYKVEYDPAYKVSGNDLYYHNGYGLPYGTLKIKETKAVEGYTTDGSYITEQSTGIQSDSDGYITLKVADLNGKTQLVANNQPTGTITEYEVPVSSGTITIQKFDSDTNTNNPQGDAINLKTKLRLVNNNDYTIAVKMDTKETPDFKNMPIVAIAAGSSQEFWTNDKGTSFLEEVEYGSYTIEEVSPTAGYLVEGKLSTSFVINDDNQNQTLFLTRNDRTQADSGIFDDVIRGGFKLQKNDDKYNTYIQGDGNLSASFAVYNRSTNNVVVNKVEYKPGDVVYTFNTDEKGYYESVNDLLPYGTYEIVETQSSLGYKLKGTLSTTFTIRKDGEMVELLTDIKDVPVYGSFRIVKDKADNTSSFNDPESGVEFTAILSSKFGTGEGAKFASYQEAYEAIQAQVKTDGKYEYNKDGSIKLKDITDADGNIILTKYEYSIVITGEDGKAESGEGKMVYGTYTIRQTSHNSEREDIDFGDIHGEVSFTITGSLDHTGSGVDQPIIEYRATNTPNPYYINITKKDIDTNKTVSFTNASFKIEMLKDADGNDVSGLTKDFAVAGTSDKMHIVGTTDEDGTVHSYVTMKVGLISYNTFRTSAQSDDSLAGMIIANTKKTQGIWSDSTNEDGSVMTPLQVVGGTYQITEVETPEGYLTLKEPITFTVVESTISRTDADGDYIYDVEVKNEQPKGELVIKKDIEEYEGKDQSLIDYSNVYTKIQFTLRAAEDIIDPADGSVLVKKDGIATDVNGNEIGKFYLNADGTYDLKNIAMGKYYLQETEVPAGLVLDDTKHDVVFTQEDQVAEHETYKVEFNDDAKTTGWVGTTKIVATEPNIINTVTKTSISKTSVTGQKELNGAQLSIYDGKEIVKDVDGKPLTWTSGDDEYKIEGLTAGKTYTLVEDLTPLGYAKASSIDFKINNDGTVNKVHMIDKMVTVSKVDMGGDEVKDAEMSVTDTDGNVIDSWTSDGTEHKVNGLEEGKTYVLHEVVAPEGYAKATDIEFTVTSADENGVKVDQHIDMTDKRVVAKKVDVCGDDVTGAQITIYELDNDQDGNVITDENGDKKVIDQWTTDGKDHYINNLEVGHTYLAVETVVPEGYVKMADYKFTVTDDGKDQTETFINKQVEISKVDAGGEEVEGAKLTITDKATGEVVESWTSTKETHYANNLEVGKTYILSEDTSPLGYVKATEIEFTVTDNGVSQKVTMVDYVVSVDKLDEEGNRLDGSTLTVIDSEGNTVDTWVSGEQKVELTDEQKTALQKGETVEWTTEDGTTIKVVPAEVKETTGEETTPIKSGVENISKDSCKVETPESPETPEDKSDDASAKSYTYTLVKTTADGTTSYANIGLDGKETSHRIEGLVQGQKYTIKETNSPDGYYYVEDTEFTADSTNVITLTDHDIIYQINKVDDKTGEFVKGVQLTLTDITDLNNMVEVELPNDGVTEGKEIVLENKLIADHTYILVETELVGGVWRSTSQQFTVPHNAVAGEQVITVTMVDNVTNTAVAKIDNHGNYVEGAKMQLIEISSDLENTAADEAVADKAEGAIDEGYLIDDEYVAVLDDNGEDVPAVDAGNDEATKPDATDAIDEGYTVDEGTVVYEWTTGTELVDVSDYVKGGYTYILREVEAPFGFDVMEDITFTATGTLNDKQVIVAVDQRETYFVSGVKVDADDTNKYLADAELTLYTADGKIAKDVNGKDCVGVTKADGVTTFEVEYNDDMFKAADAGYYMKETKSPKHYKLNKDKHYVELSADYDFAVNNPVKIIVKDKYDGFKKKTAAGLGIGLGVVALVSGIGVLATRKKKKETSDNSEAE